MAECIDGPTPLNAAAGASDAAAGGAAATGEAKGGESHGESRCFWPERPLWTSEGKVLPIPFSAGGSVHLVMHMGDDLMTVNGARVSMGRAKQTFDEKADGRLIGFLTRENHWTTYAHVTLHFRYTMPISVARQWFKHMIGFTRNEESRRYVDHDPTYFHPPRGFRAGSASIKQGSVAGSNVDEDGSIARAYAAFMQSATALYKEMLDRGVCREQARMVLPQGMMTTFVETGSLAAYARLCGLRCAPDAQEETRAYAHAVDAAISSIPGLAVTWGTLRKAWCATA